uniref:Reverse transcriptase domain-containing protein n=1 Tax=Phytophthora ramorum TaxID=164328 RepID=H3GE82_PHYRM
MLRTLSPTEQHGVALGFIVKEQRETTARASMSPLATPRVDTYEEFKEKLKLAFEPPQNEFRSRAEFLDLQQGKHDVHAYAKEHGAGRPAGDAIERVDIGHAAMKIAAPKKEFVDELIVLELDDKFDMVLGMPWLARHDPVIDWTKRTIVRFGSSSSATESDGPVGAAHAPRGACGPPSETARNAAVSGHPKRTPTTARVVGRRCETNQQGLIQSDSRGSRSVRGDAVVSTDNVDTQLVERHSAVRRLGKEGASALGADAASSADGCKRPAPEMLASSRAAGLYDEAMRDQAGLERVRPRVKPAGEYKEQLSTAGPGQEETRGAGLRTRSERRKREKLRKSRSGTETLKAVSAWQTQELETTVETLSVLTRTSIGLQYKKMRLDNPPTLASELMSLPVTSWKRFARELHDGRIEQICILSDVERVTCEAEELNQLISEGADALSAKSKKERFDEQGWDSLKASPFYKVLREYKDVLPDDIPAELPQDKGVQHEIDLVPGTKYCVSKCQGKAIDDFFESRRKAGQARESKSPHSAPTFCVKKSQRGTLDLRDGFYQILMRESDIPLTAVSTPSGMLWEWLVMPQGLKNAPATFNSRAVNGRSDVEMHTEHLRKLLELMRKHKLYANLKKCIFGATEIPVLGCLVGKNGVGPDPGKVRVINEWPTPSSVKELRQFLGLATYLCKYVSNYAGKIRPRSQLLKKEAAWEWTADCQQAFEAVKQGLTEAPILAVADQDRPFHVVEYKPGRLNVVADALSRRPDYAVQEADANAVGVVRTTTPSSSLLDDVKAAYTHDADAKHLLEYFSTPSDKSRQKLAKHLRARVLCYRVHNGLLLYSAVDDNADRIVVPDDHELKLKITYEYHDAPTLGHPGR